MNSRKLASIIITALAVWGCDGGEVLPPGHTFPERDFVCPQGETPLCSTTVEANTDAARTHELGDELEGETRTYVISALTVPDGSDGNAAGFNLDGLNSGDVYEGDTCAEQQIDYGSTTDPDQVGVDNSLIEVLGAVGAAVGDFDVNESLREQITSGSLLLLLEVSGIDSFRYDDAVSVQIRLGAVPAGATLGVTGGVLDAGQAYDVAMELGAAVNGDIYDGRVRVTAQMLNINITLDGMSLELRISSPQIRFDISETGLTNGQIGGTVTLDDLIEAAQEIEAVQEFCGTDPECGTVRELLGGFADITPSADDPETCEALSVGIAFDGTTATIN